MVRLIWSSLELTAEGVRTGVWQVNGQLLGPIIEKPAKDLINFDGKVVYRSPGLYGIWNQTVGHQH